MDADTSPIVFGAGGDTLGAHMTQGLQVKFGVEMDSQAILTWKHNFPRAKLDHMKTQEFVKKHHRKSDITVDHAHFSPPCCAFSIANQTASDRTAGSNQENIERFKYFVDVLRLLNPGSVSLEETSNLDSKMYHEYFCFGIKGMTDTGYAVEWDGLDARGFGFPSHRFQLIVLAAGYVERFLIFQSKSKRDVLTKLQTWGYT